MFVCILTLNSISNSLLNNLDFHPIFVNIPAYLTGYCSYGNPNFLASDY